METEGKLCLADVFVSISDPRQAGKVEHDLVELLVVAVNAVLVGADTFVEIELWAKEKLDWLRGYLKLKAGIPSHDTFGRLFGLIDPIQFEAAFRRWVGSILPALGADAVVAIDGKSSRRTGKVDATPLHLVSAFAAGAGLVLGQRATAEKSNEKTAIPELLATLALEGCIVTLDAMGTQTNIAQAIRNRGAHCILALKDNQPNLADRLLRAIRDHWSIEHGSRACLRHLWRRQARQSVTGSRRLPRTVSRNPLPSGRGDSKSIALVHGCCLRRRSDACSHRTCRPQPRRTQAHHPEPHPP